MRSSQLSMREYHLSVSKRVVKRGSIGLCSSLFDGFLFSVRAILGCELTILKATPTFTRPILVPFPKVFSDTACSDGDDGCAVGDVSTGGSGLSKRKQLPLHPHSYHPLLFSA